MKRDVNGVLLLAKPDGMTSNAALQKAKVLFHAKKAGHTGSLDPIATGMLPICFGEATKFAQFFIEDDKIYEVKARLGVQTDSGDRTGTEINHADIPALTEESLKAALIPFIGEIEQIPPMYSAIKMNGKRLYELARKGVEVERKARLITIYDLQLLNFEETPAGVFMRLRVSCSKGTYIRTLVEDIAKALGTLACVETLHRHQVGAFDTLKMVSLEQIHAAREKSVNDMDALLIPMHEALPSTWHKVALSTSCAFYLQQGQTVTMPGLPEKGLVTLLNQTGELLGIGEITGPQRLAPKRLIRCN